MWPLLLCWGIGLARWRISIKLLTNLIFQVVPPRKTSTTCKVMLRLKESLSIQDSVPAWACSRTHYLVFFWYYHCTEKKKDVFHWNRQNYTLVTKMLTSHLLFFPIKPTMDSGDTRADGSEIHSASGLWNSHPPWCCQHGHSRGYEHMRVSRRRLNALIWR